MPEFLGDREETRVIPGRRFFTVAIQYDQLLITNVRDGNRLMGFTYAEARTLADFIHDNVPVYPEADPDLSDYTPLDTPSRTSRPFFDYPDTPDFC